jgi:hypothetical protein
MSTYNTYVTLSPDVVSRLDAARLNTVLASRAAVLRAVFILNVNTDELSERNDFRPYGYRRSTNIQGSIKVAVNIQDEGEFELLARAALYHGISRGGLLRKLVTEHMAELENGTYGNIRPEQVSETSHMRVKAMRERFPQPQ